LPALFVWTICLFVLCCLLYIKDRPIVIIRFPSLYIGIFLVSATVLYLPSLVLLMPVYAFLFSVIQNRESMIWKKISLGVLFCFIIGNLELLRPVRLILSNVNVVLDYGVNWEHIFTAVTGVLDFETVLTLWKHTTEYHFYLSYAIVAGSVLFLFSIRKTNATAFLILFLLAGINIYMYKQKKGDYQIVRLSDFISVLLPVFSLYGYYLILKKIKYLPYILSGAFASLYLFLSVNDKKLFMRIAENDVVETRFSLKSSEDIQAVSELSEIYESRKKAGKSPVFYYMGWGVVDSANNEIIYRKIPYFESIEYDYTPRGIDILSKKYLEHALFVYPAGFLPDFLSVSSSYKAQTVSKIPGLKVFDATKGKGICLIGTGWFPYHDNLLYMRDGLEKALVIWSDSDEAVLLNFSLLTAHMSFEGYISAVSDFEYEMPAGYIDDHSVADKNEKHMKAKEFRIPLKRQSGELKVNLAFKVNKGMNVIRLIQRNDKGERSGLVLYTGINYSGQGKVSDLFLKRIKLNRILSPLSVNGRFQILTETDLKKMDIEN
ncbi:MAG TPA: hypothetical protein PKK94_18345, partial [Leptospiraceae bacterium]|nr:hypothetical protein [Leptospiraceae bacterium]